MADSQPGSVTSSSLIPGNAGASTEDSGSSISWWWILLIIVIIVLILQIILIFVVAIFVRLAFSSLFEIFVLQDPHNVCLDPFFQEI